jgi:hypothetical protein
MYGLKLTTCFQASAPASRTKAKPRSMPSSELEEEDSLFDLISGFGAEGDMDKGAAARSAGVVARNRAKQERDRIDKMRASDKAKKK